MLTQIFLQLIRSILDELDRSPLIHNRLKNIAPEKILAFILGFFSTIMIISFYNSCAH